MTWVRREVNIIALITQVLSHFSFVLRPPAPPRPSPPLPPWDPGGGSHGGRGGGGRGGAGGRRPKEK